MFHVGFIAHPTETRIDLARSHIPLMSQTGIRFLDFAARTSMTSPVQSSGAPTPCPGQFDCFHAHEDRLTERIVMDFNRWLF